ncbi:MAG: hypothetical protein V9E82_06190 [Candidatus Nanopelagicales bacterium]
MAYYRRRLAHIHVQDYTAYATAAASLLAAEPTGSVLDLGCGGGDLSQACRAGTTWEWMPART